MEFLKVPKINTSRRGFLGISALLLGSIAFLKTSFFNKKKPSKKIKLLTHDGKLVEVDLKNMPRKKRTVEKNELASWIWKNQKL